MAVDIAEMQDFNLPSLGSDMEEGTVLVWLVAPGDRVVKGDALVRVDTEKAEIDVEVWHDAVVVDLLVEPGDTVPVGTALARLEIDAGSTPTPTPTSEATPVPTAEAPPAPAPTPRPVHHEQPALYEKTTNVEVTPRLVYWPATASGAQMSEPPPAVRQPVVPASTDEATPSRAERRQAAVAALMQRSNSEIPHFHVVRQIDLTESLGWLESHNRTVDPPQRILPAALLLYAVARAANGTPVNGTYDQGPVDAEQVDLGVAVHVRGGGLMTPVLPEADKLDLDTLMVQLQEVVGRARANRLSTRDMTPATLTVTNLGDSGVDSVLGVIRPPERALVGFGQIEERPVAVDGEVVVRTMVQTTLSADHRVINGQAAARFLDAVERVLSRPTDITLSGASS